ncbi:hypothetical protein A2331_05020 [Candidatus Falkowbacteria bacterium RIFOXYB2_FULL_34_18]|uniref:AAA family ATPase n=1 Tax=Candidatus Falkowbacteria bacterium RIFOXYD2_FULL_34_120 TaxID=1798007 RepID=A0A1F5TNA7_9BACT|nr:MAG: hypothetical protein A2500_07230 [Candidatus Falkowbacteria bacterium RIFOXYC12_FULL_34_55]OGF28708.1 MAG: hypothetical protein A2331_05020 [Candidatus Falkowbacteria bacterium RIFOXYB2_FULL_34_18]OGF38073.1 MAG: hypothetical protein A2466_04200 [Candidatus Falkowbacteria bacterium RIFOXYC2_FULL_34_220]OGF38327.1 MAG: hypothetical protein A2515_06230 [Candidatus Falkowbacteria bacterium RIFOXYD12_FULL_34_57]OGF40314.1 MAG: hypothetical protein A2531_00490 [Candidatus Falkowbacteria bact
MIKKRNLFKYINDDLKEKMVFLDGPRQVGKTTLAQQIGEEQYKKYSYLNWDNLQDKKRIINSQFEPDAKLIVFDEIHKYAKWKNYVKGEWDKNKKKYDILVTGSARLDLYRHGGDSLMGRYHYYRLHPFSLAEVLEIDNKIQVKNDLVFVDAKNLRKTFDDLFVYGGFPEPFLKENKRTLRRFHNERQSRLIKEDIRDVELVRDLSALEILATILPEKVGSLLSLNSLREDLQVTHKTVAHWMDILERFYYHYRIYPHAASTIKSLRREPKMFLWDWSQVKNEGSRLENIVASHLLKFSHILHDSEGFDVELKFLRDIEGREVDFLITVNKKPWFAVEVKTSNKKATKHLKYFKEKMNIPFVYQVVASTGIDFVQNDIRVISVEKFLTALF